jgi:Lon protease-like protein
MGELIPLFPLGTPLFPGVVLPLQIFESRYRRLMHDLMALPESGDRRFFGVIAIRQGWEVEQIAPAEALYDIGCTARLQAVRPQPDGGFRIVTVGGDRFRLLDVVVGDDPPYLQAEVEWLDEEDSPQHPLDGLARSVRQQFTHYVSEVAGLSFGRDENGRSESGRGEAVNAETAVLVGAVADDPTALSYLVASVALLTTEDRQSLLAEPATRRRLAAESRLLRRELTLLKTLGAVPASLHEFATPMTVN